MIADLFRRLFRSSTTDRKLRAAVANLRACAEVLRKARRGAEFAREAERAAAELEGMLR